MTPRQELADNVAHIAQELLRAEIELLEHDLTEALDEEKLALARCTCDIVHHQYDDDCHVADAVTRRERLTTAIETKRRYLT